MFIPQSLPQLLSSDVDDSLETTDGGFRDVLLEAPMILKHIPGIYIYA